MPKNVELLAELRESRKYLWAVMPKWCFKLKDLNLTHLFCYWFIIGKCFYQITFLWTWVVMKSKLVYFYVLAFPGQNLLKQWLTV